VEEAEVKPVKPPPIDYYRLFCDGMETPLRFGIRRALKHSDIAITDADIEHICERQHQELLNWICETFKLDDPEQPE